MKTKTQLTLATLFCTLTINCLFAQQSQVDVMSQITGQVSNKEELPVEFATISLLDQDSTIITGVLSDIKGSYVFNNVKSGNYSLVIRHLEYETYHTPLFTLAAGETKSMPKISMLSGALELKEVEVVAKVPLFEVKADKIVFNVAASPSASGTNGLDLLRQSPGVTLDMDNNISLLSKGGVQIYINGRPTRLSGNDLSMMLQSLNSDNIASIEIISNPSSKYDAEGNAGIININIKKNLALGFNGIVNANGSKGNFYRSSAGLALNYGGSKINANARITQSDADFQDDLFDTKDQNGFFIDSKSYEVRNQNSYNIDLGLEALLNEKHTLAFSGTTVLNNIDNRLINNTKIFNGMTDLREILESKSLLTGNTNNYNFNLQHFWKISTSENFSADISYGKYNTVRNTDQPNAFLSPNGERLLSVQNANFDANTGIDFYSFKADYEKSFKKIKLSTGAKYGIINTNNNFDFFNVASNGTREIDQTKSNEFSYLEKVLAFYGIADYKINDKYNLNLGLRVENTNSRGQLNSTLPINNKDVIRNYTDLFPNMGLSFNDQKTHAWSLSVGRRITRPSYTDLNPFITPMSQLLVWEGNPFLRPNYIMNYQFTYTLKQSLTITNSYSRTKDFFATIFELAGENGNRIIPRNMQQATSYSISISYPLQVNKFWNITSFVNGSYNSFAGDLNGTVIDLSASIYNIRVQNNLKLPKGFNMDLSYSKSGDWIWRGSILVKGNQSLNVGLRKEFFEKKLQINLTGNDILRTNSVFFYSGNYGGILTDGTRTFDNRRYGISAALKFGNQKLKAKVKKSNSLDDAMRRLEGSN